MRDGNSPGGGGSGNGFNLFTVFNPGGDGARGGVSIRAYQP
jgi:hypothetical protein